MPRPFRVALVLLPLMAGLAAGAWFLLESPDAPTPADTPPPVATGPGPAPTPPPSQPPAGKLVVLLIFDQMRGDYLARWASAFGPDGFERLKREGVWFADCHLPYACTSTGPGHASLVAGAPPSVHGIVENDWYDRKDAARVYSVQPTRPYDRVPPLPGAAGPPVRGVVTGFTPERLLAETVGDKLKAATGGKGRVVSLSVKDRAAALMGGKKPDAAYCFDYRDGLFTTNSYFRDRPHPWAEAFNAGKPADAWVNKPWLPFKADAGLYDKLAGPDDAPGEAPGVAQGLTFPHPMSDLTKPGPAYYGAVETSPFGNELLLGLARRAVADEKLGHGPAADLLCVSFSSSDLVGHAWGPDSWEVLDVTLRADRLTADLLKFLDETVGKDRYTVVLVGDHGVCPIPEQKRYPEQYPGAARVPDVAFLGGLMEALDEVYGVPPAGPTRWIEPAPADALRVLPWVYLNRAAITARGLDPAAVALVAAQWCGNRPYMLTAFTRKQIETGELPPHGFGSRNQVRDAAARAKLSYHPDRCGDFLVVPKPGVQLTGYAGGTGHGSPHPYDTHVPLVVSGAGVPAAGKIDRRVSALTAAPVLARALGIDPPAGAAEKVPDELGKVK
ncbi:MAG: alkaline phosphatase family protein [Gemmataceae bacterium]|nr:alkaline phosphatase family protein [Gemmataceae bacterium]